jgi:DNA primase
LRGIDLVLEEGMNVKVLLLPEGEDPDSFARKKGASGFQKFIDENETDFIRFKTNLLVENAEKDPIAKATINFRCYPFGGCNSRYHYPVGIHKGMQQAA